MTESTPKVREFTARAIATGFLLGGILAPCNIYTGLKIGFSFNMSIAAALLAYGFWNGLHRLGKARPLGLLENNINQTTASSAASILSAGLVAPIPALALLTGQELVWGALAVWLFVVSLLGVFVALAMRRQMLEVGSLPFPNGVATAETVREIYAEGREAAKRLKILATGIFLSGGLKAANAITTIVPPLKFPTGFGIPATGATAASGIQTITLTNLGFQLNPSLLLIGFGAIIGPRVGLSLVFGSVIAWLWIGPAVLARGWITPGPADPDAFWFEALNEWLLWPGVTLMVVASLTAFALAGVRSFIKARPVTEDTEPAPASPHPIWTPFFVGGLIIATSACVLAQFLLFSIPPFTGFLAVALTFLLAVVAARVSGETGIPPIGALGKITQLSFGALAPGNVTTNLMAANVTGGAAGQCSDLLHDLKTGQLIGASPRLQSIAQCFGILSGALFGSAAYLILIPDPASMLITEEWPAPAVVTWKAVAEVLRDGFHSFPQGTVNAIAIAALVGIALAVAETLLPKNRVGWVPSAPSIGFAFIIPASISLAMGLGALIAVIIGQIAPAWKKRYLVVLAAGLVAGESLTGVGESILNLLQQML